MKSTLPNESKTQRAAAAKVTPTELQNARRWVQGATATRATKPNGTPGANLRGALSDAKAMLISKP